MSSKRARKETVVDLVSPDKSPESSDAKELERLRKEINHKNEVCLSIGGLINVDDYFIRRVSWENAERVMLSSLH